MNPIALSIGKIQIRWYAIIMLIAVFFAIYLTKKETSKYNIKDDFIFNMCFWAVIFGYISARLYYVIFNWEYYSQNLLEILMIWKGGLAIHGGIIGGLITIIIYAKKYKLRVIRYLDFLVVPLAIAQSIGRWGNFFNSEAYGIATTFEELKALHIPEFIINGMKIEGVYYMPTFLFESIACLVLFIILILVRKTTYLKVGSLTAYYLIGYGIIRFLIESIRTDALILVGFKVAQIISIGMIVIGIIILMINKRKSRFEDLYNDKQNINQIKF